MHILIGIILVLFLLAISKTLRTLALIGVTVITGVVISMVLITFVDGHDAISIIAALLLAGIALIIWVLIQMGMHLGNVAGGSVDLLVDEANSWQAVSVKRS